MKNRGKPIFVGVYLVWRRWSALAGLGGLVLAVVASALVITSSAANGSMATILGSLASSAVAAGLIGWFGVRRLLRPVRVMVSSRGVDLEPVHGGPPENWRWDELELSLHADDGDGTLELCSARSGAILLAKASDSSMATLLDAIARAGGRVN